MDGNEKRITTEAQRHRELKRINGKIYFGSDLVIFGHIWSGMGARFQVEVGAHHRRFVGAGRWHGRHPRFPNQDTRRAFYERHFDMKLLCVKKCR